MSSEESLTAVENAGSLAQEADELVLMTVVKNPEPVEPNIKLGNLEFKLHKPKQVEAHAEELQEHQKMLDYTKANHASKKFKGKVTTMLEHGDPRAVLVDQARVLGASYIVIGSRGLGRAKGALLGSVTDHVIHHAQCPVIVVPNRKAE